MGEQNRTCKNKTVYINCVTAACVSIPFEGLTCRRYADTGTVGESLSDAPFSNIESLSVRSRFTMKFGARAAAVQVVCPRQRDDR